LNNGEILFKQLQDEIATYHLKAAAGKTDELPALFLYQYKPQKPDEDLFSLAARLNLPYDTLVTLNSLDNAAAIKPADIKSALWIIIPNQPGLFVPAQPVTELEKLMLAWRRPYLAEAHSINLLKKGKKTPGYFFRDARFHPMERAYFLKVLFRFPLPDGYITSRFGERKSPFTGANQFHTGIDIAAAEGTDILAAREGIVSFTGIDKDLGNYLILKHDGGFFTVYGHLLHIDVSPKQEVYSGMVIGQVGNTGLSTGPHLHFEIKKEGEFKDPTQWLILGDKRGNKYKEKR
jgi:murein DD-endopeptidase MepM/ murein hydrolase activator NlpD